MIDLALVMLPTPHLQNPLAFLNLGIMYVAAAADASGFDVELVDMRDGINLDLIPRAKFVGLSATSDQIAMAKFVSRSVSSRTIIGGPHAFHRPDDCLGVFDTVVVGEAEYVIREILLEQLDDLVVPDRILDLDHVAFPAYDMLPKDRCFSDAMFTGEKYGTGPLTASIMASRGCPFDCAFCGIMYRKVVRRSPFNVGREVEWLMSLGVTHFRFGDDNFTLKRSWSMAVADEMRRLGAKWKCITRADLLDADLCETLAQDGCKEVSIGMESGSQEVLDLVRKGITTDNIRVAIQNIRSAKMISKVNIITGLPGETERSFTETQNLLLETKPDKWVLNHFCPFPGCPIEKDPEAYGVIIEEKDLSKYTQFPSMSLHSISGESEPQDPMMLIQRHWRMMKWLTENLPPSSQPV